MRYYYPCVPNRLSIDSPFLAELDKSAKWWAEIKKNGWRCLACKDTKLTLWTRKKTLITDPLPNLRAALNEMLPERTIADGELLEKRTKDIKELFYGFDIMIYKNVPLFAYPLKDRRLLLENVIKPIEGLIELSIPVQVGKIKLYHDNIDRDGCEGIVLKKIDSPYITSSTSCPHNPFWLKVKKAEDYQYANKR